MTDDTDRIGGDHDELSLPERYTVLSVMGRGAAGVVHKAHDTILDRDVAIKTLHPRFADTQVILRFQQEAKILSTLKHKNIVEVLVLGVTDDNCPYMVMTFVDGKRLTDLMAMKGRLSPSICVSMFKDICDGMAHAHRRGILHRDLKPDNIMLLDQDSDYPTPVIVDFGVGKLEQAPIDGSLTKPGSMIGTPSYMSPEQLLGKTVDARCDIYSLGCVLFECLTGLRPFDGSSELEMVKKKQLGTGRSIESVPNLDVPKGLKEIVAKCLEPNPDNRFQSMEELRGSFDLFATKPGSTAGETADITASKPDHKFSRGALISAGGLAFIAIAAFIVLQIAPFFDTPKELKVKERFPDPLIRDFEHALTSNLRKEPNGHIKGRGTTDKELQTLSGERGISELYLASTRCTGDGFSALANVIVKNVVIEDSQLSASGVRALCNIRTISFLQIRRDPNISFAEMRNLELMPDLTSLALEDCGATDEKLKQLPCLPQVENLDLSNNRITDKSFTTLKAKFPNVKLLGLGRTGTTTGAIVRFIHANPKITSVSFRKDNRLNDQDLAILATASLVKIYAPNCQTITDAGIRNLSVCKTLKDLYIVSCKKISREAIKKFNQALPNCKVTGPEDPNSSD